MSDKVFKLSCETLLQAVRIALNVTGDYTEMRIAGDFGQDEGKGEFGMGNDSFSIVAHANGTATLSLDEDEVCVYMEKETGHG